MTEPPAEEPAALPDDTDDTDDTVGSGIVNLSFAGTGALLVVGVAGVAAPDQLGELTAAVSGILFLIGVVTFLWGYATGVVRSQEEAVTLPGLFFLSGTAPKVVRFRLRIALLAQVVVAVAAAVVRPYTAVAFAVLAPMFGLGLMATWGARHGQFFAKDERR